MKHTHPVIRSVMWKSLEKFDGKVHWKTIKPHLAWNDMPKICQVGDGKGEHEVCWNDLLGFCPNGRGCDKVSTHGLKLSSAQARQVTSGIQKGLRILNEEGP